MLVSTYKIKRILLWSEQVAWLTASGLTVLDRANEELALAQEIGNDNAKYNSRESAADEAFPCLLRAQFNQWCASEEESEHISHHIVANDHRNWHYEPDQS